MPAVMASGNQCVAEAVVRRWSTSQGQLIDDPNYGYNVNDLIGATLSQAQIAYAQQQMSAEAQKDERVLSCQVTLALNNATQVLTINALVTTAVGPFTLVAAVSSMSTSLLLVSP